MPAETALSTMHFGKGLQKDQVPDEGAQRFVRDMLEQRFDVDTSLFPATWIPLTLFGTLDWIMISGWWAWYYTGIFRSSETYHYVFQYFTRNPDTGEDDFCEFDPDRIVMFEEDPSFNAFDVRFQEPGITKRERGEVLKFLEYDVFKAMDQEPPPQEVLEMIAYCAFMWVLSDNGRAWLCETDPVWDCVDTFGVAYLELWERTLLDPRNVKRTKRKLGTCVNCEEQLYCVSGAAIFDSWYFVCNDCLVRAAESEEVEVDKHDRRIEDPLCGFRGGTCYNTSCVHNPIGHEELGDRLAEFGAKRVDVWRKARLESNEPRKLAGRTVKQTVEYFQDIDYHAVLDTLIDRLQNTGKLEEAEDVLIEMLGDPNIRDIKVTIRVMETLLEVYGELGKDTEAEILEFDLRELLQA